MGFVTPALLGGMLLVGLPIVLHLIMRREAKHFVFPALRFVQLRRSVNQHRLRLRHLLLLALRCAIIVLLALALARPTLLGASGAGGDGGQIAAVLVFDNSLRMDYQHQNESRLAAAQKLAGWLLEQLPADGPIAIVKRTDQHRGQTLDRAAAELRVQRMQLGSVARPMEDMLRDAGDWLGEQEGYRGEIYVFTDLAAAEWSNEAQAALAAELDELPGANVYLIDVGVERPRNLALGALRLSGQQITPGSLLEIHTALEPIGAMTDRGEATIELYVGSEIDAPRKRGQQTIRPTGDEPVEIEFSIAGLEVGTHQGYVRVAGTDPLAWDDVRYFTVDVREPRKVLLVGESVADTLFLREALSPSSAGGVLKSRFSCDGAVFGELIDKPLADFDVVCLVDPPPLDAMAWQALVDYVHAGGGLGIFLGRNGRRDPLNEPAPQQLLPAKLRWQSREATYLRPTMLDHPALSDFKELADSVPWSEFPVFTYWELEPGPGEVTVVASYANGKPALLERQVGSGRVLTMTTSVSDPAHDNPWNLLPTGSDPWPFLALMNGIVDYLAGASDVQLNYLAGQTAVLQLSPEEQVANYVLQMPDGEAVRQSLSSGEREITIAATEELGNYRLRAGGELGRLDRGFSVNCPPELSWLDRADVAEILEVLGTDRARVARTRQEIEVRVGIGRVGRELFPALILAVALVLGAEHLLSNRFHQA